MSIQVYTSTLLLLDILTGSKIFVILNNAIMNLEKKIAVVSNKSFSMAHNRVHADEENVQMPNFIRCCQTVSKWVYNYTHPLDRWEYLLIHFLAIICIVQLPIFSPNLVHVKR